MQISSKQFYRSQLENLSRLQQSSAELQQQIATGKRLAKPSDDPVAFTQASRLENRQSGLDQFKRNIDAGQQRLTLEENVLSQTVNISIRLQELAIQGSSDTLGQADKNTVAIEMEQLAEQLASLGNTRDGDGEYMFGGYRVKSAPFAADSSGEIEYRGDQGRREIEIADGIKAVTGSNGDEVFMRIPREGKAPASIFEIVSTSVAKLRAGMNLGEELGSMTAAVNHFTTYQTIAGSRLAKLDGQQTANDASSLITKTSLSSLQDTDMEKAVTELKQKLLSLEASQASFVKITEATLFNYLR